MEQVSLHLAVLRMVGDRVGQDKSQGGVVAVAVADTRTDPERDSVGGEAVPAAGQEKAPVSSFVPCLGSSCPDLD